MRLCILYMLTLTLMSSQPVFGLDRPSGTDNPLSAASDQLKRKHYQKAYELASSATVTPETDFILGISSLKSVRSEEAVLHLEDAVKSYPLLADYGLFYLAQAYFMSGEPAASLKILKQLQKEYPSSPLSRQTLMQQGDILFKMADFREAEAVYRKFVDLYASGNDAVQATYQIALCRENQGDKTGAISILRSIWLNNPGSTAAKHGEEALQKLSAVERTAVIWTPQELYKRSTILYDQKKYDLALKTLRMITAQDQKPEFLARVSLKIGQTLLKSRRYQEAENQFREILTRDIPKDVISDTRYWLAKAMEKGNHDDQAIIAYIQLANGAPDSVEADDAILDAAFIRKFQNRPSDAVALFKRLADEYPASTFKQRTIWEIAWGSYLSGDLPAATAQFQKLLHQDEYREKALYWYGRTLISSGHIVPGMETLAVLLNEYPTGFYALSARETFQFPPPSFPRLTKSPVELLPLPQGHERVKALIKLGLPEETGKELASVRKKLNGKGKNDPGLARLYLESGDYNGAMALARNDAPWKSATDNQAAWGLLYPKAFNELVDRYTAEAGVSPALAYALMRAESSFSPAATSPVGARGLMQLMPETAATMLRVKHLDKETLYEPELNIRLGTMHLRDLLKQYKGNLVAVIASYNAGSHNVDRWLKTFAGLPKEEFIESIPYGETREYVKKVLAVAGVYRNLYGID